MTIREAFEELLNSPALVGKSGLTAVHKRTLRHKLKTETLGEKAMKKWLLQAGFQVKTEWKLPRGHKKTTAGEAIVLE